MVIRRDVVEKAVIHRRLVKLKNVDAFALSHVEPVKRPKYPNNLIKILSCEFNVLNFGGLLLS